MDMISTSAFWVALAQIMVVNIMLSGDNAVVIALASRSLPPKQQKMAIMLGSGAAILLRIVLTVFAVMLMELPYLKLVGGLALLWIAASMLNADQGEGEFESHASLWAAVRTILVADFIMSLDNVIGVAAAAKGNYVLLIIGLVLSIPLIIFGSQIILKLMERFPTIILGGAALLGWVAGDMIIADRVLEPYIASHSTLAHWLAPALCAVAVVVVGKWLDKRALEARRAAQARVMIAVYVLRMPGHETLYSLEHIGKLCGMSGQAIRRMAAGVVKKLGLPPGITKTHRRKRNA
ncbi:MAG: TerC family protein [Betaproteobacteria bacterium]|nr:TerC family protein [Betaproteobacteria bacterium]